MKLAAPGYFNTDVLHYCSSLWDKSVCQMTNTSYTFYGSFELQLYVQKYAKYIYSLKGSFLRELDECGLFLFSSFHANQAWSGCESPGISQAKRCFDQSQFSDEGLFLTNEYG